MQVLLAVIADLYQFIRSFVASPQKPVEPEARLDLPAPAGKQLLSPLHPATVVLPAPSLDTATVTPVRTSWSGESTSRIAALEVPLHREPTEAFDNVLTKLPYGTVVTEVRRSGRWVLIEAASRTGWVLADVVLPEAEVLPQFKLGYAYDAPHGEVQKLRNSIADGFNGIGSCSPLMGVEYVTYKLKCGGRTIVWPETYNRLPGTWQRKLRGVRGIRIDVMPHTGSVMEYIIDDVGYVAYVEKVAPDLKITVSGIGLTNESQYTEQVLPHNVWRELRPVFIQVT
jgi:hypothetical protein